MMITRYETETLNRKGNLKYIVTLEGNIEPRPYNVVDRNESGVTVESKSGVKCTKNRRHLKKFRETDCVEPKPYDVS